MQHLDATKSKSVLGTKKKHFKHIDPSSTDYLKRSLLGGDSSFAATEAYKAARTNLLFTRVDEGCQILAFTSTSQGEGKTVNCCNLALSVAENGQKVLIIDADLRRPKIAQMFGLRNGSGLSEFLAGISAPSADGSIGQIPLIKTKYPNLSVIPSGHIPPNPAELLASNRLKLLLDTASQHFDYIFIDTPPVSVVTDAAVLSKSVKGYVFVVRAGVTPLEMLRSVVLKMEQLDATILGFLLNDLDAKSGSYKYKGYRNYGNYSKNSYGEKRNGYAAASTDEQLEESSQND